MTASNPRLSRRNGNVPFAGSARSWPRDPNRAAVELLLNVTSLVICSCQSAFNTCDAECARRYIRNAKKSYASALRCAGRLSFTVQDVQAFEARTIKLEKVIADLERKWGGPKSTNHDGRVLEEERSPS